jgi:tetratricopeptide (TPR) repeat protein
MNILVHKDDFIFELFKVKNNDTNELLNKIKEYYTINGIQPTVIADGNTISISIDDKNITSERKKYQNLINLCELRKFSEALPLAQEMAIQSPAISDYHRILGQIHSEMGNQDSAIDALIDALRWDPENEYALIMMGNIYAREYDDIETAMRYYDQVVKANPKDNIALNNIAANLLRQGKLDEAYKYFNNALEIDDKYPNTYVGLGMLFAEKKEYTKSFEYFIEGLKIYRKDDDLRKHLLGNAYGIAEKVMESELPDLLTGIYKQKLEQQGNRTILITEDETIPTAAKIEFAENYNKKEDVVKYNPSYPAYQHLIMHELVHLELLLEARSNDENELFISNTSHKQKFKEKLSNYTNQLLRKGINQDSVDKVINDLFDGLNRQIFNSAPDLFIEDRLYNNYPDLKPIQFVSLYNMIQNGIKAVTKKEIVELSDPWVLSTSKTLNIINAITIQ